MLLASLNRRARPPPASHNLTHVNNPGIIANVSDADLRKLFTEPRNRLFTSSESAITVVGMNCRSSRVSFLRKFDKS
jgi:hypothetical protein